MQDGIAWYSSFLATAPSFYSESWSFLTSDDGDPSENTWWALHYFFWREKRFWERKIQLGQTLICIFHSLVVPLELSCLLSNFPWWMMFFTGIFFFFLCLFFPRRLMICCSDIISSVTGADLKKKKVSCLFFIRQNRVVWLSLHVHKKKETVLRMCDKIIEFEHPAHNMLMYTAA